MRGQNAYDLRSIRSVPACSRDCPETCDDDDDGDDGFVPGMPFVCPLQRKNRGIVLIVEILASERRGEKERGGGCVTPVKDVRAIHTAFDSLARRLRRGR